MNRTENQNDQMVKVVIVITFGMLIYGVLINLIIIPIIWGLVWAFKKDRYIFVAALFVLIVVAKLIDNQTGISARSFLQNGDALNSWFMFYLQDRGVSEGILRPLYNYLMFSWKWAPVSTLVIAGIFLYRTKLWDKVRIQKKDHSFKPSKFLMHRNKAHGVFLGLSKDNKKPLFLTREERARHTHVLGATGFGKTESVLLPMIRHDIMRGGPLMLIDAKGDERLLRHITGLAECYGRKNDIRYFSSSLESDSWTYNPFKDNNETIIAEKIISALEWSEPFYKKVSHDALLAIVGALKSLGRECSLTTILHSLRQPQELLAQARQNASLQSYVEDHKKHRDYYAGLITDLSNLVQSPFGRLMIESHANMNLFEAFLRNYILIFQASALNFPETARTFGRLLLRDIMCLVNALYDDMPQNLRKFYPVYIDEFASFATPAFVECMRMMRASGVNVTLLHQSLGDLDALGVHFKQQVVGNTNVKIILKVGDNETVEETARMTGTKPVKILTHQVESGLFDTRQRTGMGSEVAAEAFNIHPNTIRSLGIGEAVVIVGMTNKVDRVQLDYLDLARFDRTALPKRPYLERSAENTNQPVTSPPVSQEIF